MVERGMIKDPAGRKEYRHEKDRKMKTERIVIRLSSLDKRMLDDYCQRNSVSMSRLVRKLLIDKIAREYKDQGSED